MNKGYTTMIVSMGFGVAYNLEAEVLREGTFYASPICIRVSLVGPFMSHFRLLMGIILDTMIIMARVVVNP